MSMSRSVHKRRRLALFAAFLSALTGGTNAAAEQAATHPCASVVDVVQRLACYDRTFPPTAETRAQMVSKARGEFGLDRDAGRKQAALAQTVAEPQDIESVLARLDYNGSPRTFTLDNGQVWVQTDGVGSGNVKVGETVRIRKAMLGSYMLVMPSGVAVRVKRKR